MCVPVVAAHSFGDIFSGRNHLVVMLCSYLEDGTFNSDQICKSQQGKTCLEKTRVENIGFNVGFDINILNCQHDEVKLE